MDVKKLEITAEMREKLNHVLGFRLDSRFSYVPRAFRNGGIDKKYWPVFTLRGQSGVDSALMEDEIGGAITHSADGGSSVQIKNGAAKIKICRRGIETWRNWYDRDGNPIPSPARDADGRIPEEALSVFPPVLLTELTNAITEHQTLTEEELRGLE